MKNTILLPSSLVGCGAVAIALGLLTSPLKATDENTADTKAKDAGTPDMAEMMKKMEALAAPGPEHQKIASLAGEWETEAQCYMTGPDSSPNRDERHLQGQDDSRRTLPAGRV